MAIHFPSSLAAVSFDDEDGAPQPNVENPALAPEFPVPADDLGPHSSEANAAAAEMYAGLYDGDMEPPRRRIDELLDDEEQEAEEDHGPLSEADVTSLVNAGPQLAQTTRFYHATRTRNLGGETGILNQGLDPDFGGSGAAAGDAQFEDQSRNKVHVTRSRQHGQNYKQFFEEGVHPSNAEKRTEKSPAEVLKVSLPRDLRMQLEQDPDDQLARTLDVAIPPENIKPTAPAPLPGERQEGREDEYDRAFRMHQARGHAENEALYTNMSPAHQTIIDKYPEGEERATAMQMLKQGLMSAQNPLKNDEKILP